MIESLTPYQEMIKKLKAMDEKQLLELFHDIEDIATVERIADCAYHFVENHTWEELGVKNNEKSEQEDAQELDDSRRYSEWKSDQNRPY
jgi:hypothetical protein